MSLSDLEKLYRLYDLGSNEGVGKEQMQARLAPSFDSPRAVTLALQEITGAARPRSVGGVGWGGFRGDYEDLELVELKGESFCEGLPLSTKSLVGK